MTDRIGFIGLGIMGSRMAANLIRAGFSLTVYNRTADRADPLKEMGAKVSRSPADLMEEADVTIVMLTGPEAVDAVLWGPGGGYEKLDDKKTFVNMSTVSPEYTRGLARRIALSGAAFVDAPVLGTRKPAEEGTLIVLAAGGEEKIGEIAPVFDAMSKKTVFCGEAGQGSMMKMAANLLLGVMLEGFSEALNLGAAGGLSMDAMLDVFLNGPMSCLLFQMKAPMIKEEDYPPQFPLKHMTKDLKFICDTAFDTGAPVPAGRTALGLYRAAVARGLGDMDFAAIAKLLKEMGGPG